MRITGSDWRKIGSMEPDQEMGLRPGCASTADSVMSAFGEEALYRLAGDDRESGCLDRRKEVGGSTSSRRWPGFSHVDGSLTVCAEVSYNCYAVGVERWREMVQLG